LVHKQDDLTVGCGRLLAHYLCTLFELKVCGVMFQSLCPLQLSYAKKGKKHRHANSLQPNEVSQTCTWFFFFWEVWVFSNFVVPNVFPNMFSQNVFNNTSIYPISFALSSIFATYISTQKEGVFPKLDYSYV
jgi:hypothetical protein